MSIFTIMTSFNAQFTHFQKLLSDKGFIKDDGSIEQRMWKGQPEFKKEIDDSMSDVFTKFQEKIWALLHNKKERPICAAPLCNNFTSFEGARTGYKRTCSIKCSSNDPYVKNKTKATIYAKFGGKHFTQDPDWIKTYVENCHEKGSYEKGISTFKEKYGVNNRYQLESVKEKIKETNIERYGVENAMQNEEIKAKTRKTTLERYGAFYNPIQQIKTMLEKYGVENPQQVKSIRDKTVETTLDRYGAIFNPVKTKETNIERYGVENAMQNEEIKAKTRKTTFDRHGAFFNPVESKKTFLVKYGVENGSQHPEILEKIQAYRTKNFTLPSGQIRRLQGYEGYVLLYLLHLGLNEDEIYTNKASVPRIEYTHIGKKSKYFPDIFIPSLNTLIEVKSPYTHLKDNDVNLAKQQASKDAGYNHYIVVWDKKKGLLEVI